MYTIRLGMPEMASYWQELVRRNRSGEANKGEQETYKKLGKAMKLLAENLRHAGLNSHEIDQLSRRYGMKVWESYLENNKPRAGRLFWVCGPNQAEITVIGVEPHPDDKSNAYRKITLSQMP